jgi:hypothetical protein
MRSASSTARTDEITTGVISSNFRSILKLEVYNNDQWESIEDLDETRGVDWAESGKKENYANFALTPLAGTIAFSLVNDQGKYSDGSGTNAEGVIDKETKVRLSVGYIASDQGDLQTDTLNLNDTSGLFVGSYFYHMAYGGSYTSPTATGLGVAPPHFSDIFKFYDAQNYDTTTYSLDAYTINTWDSGGKEWAVTQDFIINTNTTGGTVYYRTFNDPLKAETSTESDWTSAGATVNGNKTITVSTTYRFLQIAVTFDGIAYTDDLRINSISVNYYSYAEFLYKSVYYLDRPSFNDPKAPEIGTVRCKGRDAYKRAIETDINITDLSSGVSIENLIKEVCDECNILYSATSINITASIANRTLSSGVGIVKCDKILEYCMNFLNIDGYQMYLEYDDTLEDNIMYVIAKPTDGTERGVLNYNYYESIGDVSKNSDRILQRITVFSNDQVPRERETISTDVYTTNGSKTITWSGSYAYKSFDIDDSLATTYDITDWEVTPTQATFTLSNLSGQITITSKGSDFATPPTYEGEAFDIDNHFSKLGITHKIVNPLLLSDTECKDMAESYIGDYGNPIIEARSLTWPYLYIFPQINDLFLLWRRFIFTNDLFFVTKISHHWDNASSPREQTVFNLEDSGIDSVTPIWDDGLTDWDKGFVWDMGISTSQSTKSEIDAISDSLASYNVDFT